MIIDHINPPRNILFLKYLFTLLIEAFCSVKHFF
jgi:hypothetical protein